MLKRTLVTVMTPSRQSVCRFAGMKPAPMPWMGWGPGAPPLTGQISSLSTDIVTFRQSDNFNFNFNRRFQIQVQVRVRALEGVRARGATADKMKDKHRHSPSSR
jgi:hypothetical protein